MVNKKNLWFLTLFSLVLVLSVYYVTMPNELLITNNGEIDVDNTLNDDANDASVSYEESDIISSLKVEDNNEVQKEIETFKEKLTDVNTTTEEKNEAFDALKEINQTNSKEEALETKLKQEYGYDCFVKIDDDQVRVVVGSGEHTSELANNIMRSVQEEFDTKMYISVQFQA